MNKELLPQNRYNELFKYHYQIPTSTTGLVVYYTLGFLIADDQVCQYLFSCWK
jgi:hypothetical protein